MNGQKHRIKCDKRTEEIPYDFCTSLLNAEALDLASKKCLCKLRNKVKLLKVYRLYMVSLHFKYPDAKCYHN